MRKAPESSLRAVYKKHCSSKFGEVAKVEVRVYGCNNCDYGYMVELIVIMVSTVTL